jgi:hypothetical protein
MSSRLLVAALLGASALALSGLPADAASRFQTPAIGEQSVTITPAREASEGPRREDRRQDRRNDRRNDRRSTEAPSDLQLLLAREASEGPRREDRRQDRRNDRRNDRRGAALDSADDGFILLVREGSSGGGRQRRNGGRTGR